MFLLRSYQLPWISRPARGAAMDPQPSRHPVPCRRIMLLSLPARCFLSSWRLTIRCGCEGERHIPLPELATVRLRDRELRTLGKLVRRLTCQSCGQRPTSVIAEHAPSDEREEMLA